MRKLDKASDGSGEKSGELLSIRAHHVYGDTTTAATASKPAATTTIHKLHKQEQHIQKQ